MSQVDKLFASKKDTDPVIVICFESAEFQPILQYKKMANGHLEFNATLQTVDEINRNSKLYPANVLMEALRQPRIVAMVLKKSWFAELSHPWDRKNFLRSIDTLPKNISHRICTQPTLQGNKVVALIHTVEPMGKVLDSWIIDEQCEIGFSMRGITPYEMEKTTPVQHKVIKAPMTVLTFDAVAYPSHSSAQIETSEAPIQMEQFDPKLEPYHKVTLENVAEFIAAESYNFRIFKEELGIDINAKIPITRTESGEIDCTLKDGRLARLKVENNIMLQVASYL
jgi:hypothetical protein